VPVALALAALIGLAGAVSLAAVAGARRGERALPEFLARQEPPHAAVFAFEPGDDLAEVAAALRGRPYVVEASRLAPLLVAGPDVEGTGTPRRFIASDVVDRGADALNGDPIVVDGRLPDESRAQEVAVDEEFVERTGVGVGERYPLRTYSAERTGDTDPNGAPPDRPPSEVTVVGVVRYPQDLVPARLEQDNTAVDNADLYLTPAFWEEHGPDLATFFGVGVGVRLQGGRHDLGRFQEDAARLLGDASFIDEVDPEAGIAGIPLDGVHRAIDLETRALQGLAALAAVAGLVLVGQALSRQISLDAADDPVLGALGMTRRQRIAAATLRAAVPAAGGAALAAIGAVALSPLTPVGVARRAVRTPGVDVDALVLALGAATIALLVCGWAAVAAWGATMAATRETARRAAGASSLSRLVAGARLPVTGWTGLTLALQRGRGRAVGLLRAGVVVSGATVVGVTASLVFVASLDRLTDRPEDYGVTWDVSVGEAGSPEQGAVLEDRIVQDTDVDAFAGITGESLAVAEEGIDVPALVLFEGTGTVGPRVVEGRAPRGPDDIAFAGQTMEDLGLVVGDTVAVAIGDAEPASLRVTGEVLLNGAGLIDDLDNGEGALLPDPAQQRLVPLEDRESSFPSTYLLRLAPGADRPATLARLEQDFPRTVVTPLSPSEVDNLARVSSLPVVLAGLVAVLGTGTIVHVMVSTVRRRRRDLAMLSGLGFVRRQVSATLAWQATAVAAVALVVGLPVGVALGRWSWRLTADALWVVSRPEIPVPALVLVAVAAVVVVNAAALGAAALVRRGSPSAALRAE
jgi:hypothetical protein